MSDAERISEGVSADPSDAVRAEVEREFAGRLARAEMENQAAKAGITLPQGFTDYLDSSRLIREDGNPSAEAIAKVLEPFQTEKEPLFPQLTGAGRSHPDAFQYQGPRVSLDARHRK
ncbi:hypothetical protein F9278_18680 [Streptomyces phaeolivaceus]|uniref:Uncharacterized protein n=1 Tax=Streptomyces phaeolivaceus TaxID=2653200 RepID=A0A5P8K536_9ACTN|nr:hypothetical protein [Streptomyces phaeolivaceus]QFQ97908.1 hypothetical protein F9278_18680 [Streptomyces phaeolivaceus]